MIEYSVIPRETILVFLVICTLILLLIQIVRRKWNFKKYIGVISLSAILGIYLYNIFGDIALGGASAFDDFYYSKIPFGNLIYNHVEFEENIIAHIASAKSIMRNGGILESEIDIGGVIKQRYWINIE